MGYNVLIVDDSRTTRSIIAKALTHANVPLARVLFAQDGHEALEILMDDWVDIVFADLNMPRLSGVEMVDRMADDDLLSTIPVVIVSTEGRQERIDALLARGVAAYLRKPFPPEQVAKLASTLLGEPAEDPYADQVEDAFFGAIEGFAMLVAQPVAMMPPAPERAVLVEMEASGVSTRVGLAIATTPEGAVAIAEAALGDTGDTAAQDAVRELLNLVAGHLVDSLAGGPFVLDPPHSSDMPGDAAWSTVGEAGRCLGYDLEGHPLLLGVTTGNRW